MKALVISGQPLLACLLIASLFLGGQGAWIDAKARLAQVLIADSWEQGARVRPWPWADTWPVARLRYASRELYILSGSHGSSLAFGPGHVDGTSLPGKDGTSVVGGHRDTHFSFLEHVEPGESLEVQSADMRWHRFEIDRIEIVDTTFTKNLHLDPGTDRLVLVTCYPFDAITAGGPLRYVVTANKKGQLHKPAFSSAVAGTAGKRR